MDHLSRYAGLHVTLSRPPGDSEAKAYSLEFKRVLQAAGWIVDDEHDAVFSDDPTGLLVQMSASLAVPVPGAPERLIVPAERVPVPARALLEAFSGAGLAIQAGGNDQIQPTQVILLVGHKP